MDEAGKYLTDISWVKSIAFASAKIQTHNHLALAYPYGCLGLFLMSFSWPQT